MRDDLGVYDFDLVEDDLRTLAADGLLERPATRLGPSPVKSENDVSGYTSATDVPLRTGVTHVGTPDPVRRALTLSIRGSGHGRRRDCAPCAVIVAPEGNAAIEQACNPRVSVFTGCSLSLAPGPRETTVVTAFNPYEGAY